MSEQAQERKEHYKRVRTEFDDLDTEDKVLFLMEATVSTIARGVDEFGRAVSDEINKAFSRRAEKKERREKEKASPGTTASTASQSKSSKSGTSTKSTSPGSTSDGNGSEDKEEGTV